MRRSTCVHISKGGAWALAFWVTLVVCGSFLPAAFAQTKGDKHFNAVVTDTQGVETDLKNILFYWEEKVSETAFVPHELKQVPVKRGAATVNVKFEKIKQIDIAPAADKGHHPVLHITLTDGKTGDFALATAGSFKGESDFGEVELPATGLKKIVFK